MCLYELSKLLVFIVNLAVWVGGAALLVVGVYLLIVGDAVVEVAGIELYYTGAWILLWCGVAMLVLGFCGCCGAMKESPLLLKLYFFFLLILFVVECAVGIWALLKYGSIEAAVEEGMNEWATSIESNDEPDAFIAVQNQFHCCGINSTYTCEMWYDIYMVGNETNEEYYNEAMTSCEQNCANNEPGNSFNCTTNVETCEDSTIYTEGCVDAVTTFIEDNITLIAAFGLAFGLVCVIGMLLTCYMIRSIKDDKRHA